jgi:hypothetical protein
MQADHQQLALEQVAVGMVLSDDVIDDHGAVLLVKGSVLTSAMLQGLARHHIKTVPVALASSSPAGPSSQTPATEPDLQRLAFLFRRETVDDASSLLHQYLEQYRLGVNP